MINNRQTRALTYFITRALFIGLGFSRIYFYTDKDSWIAVILGLLLGIIIIYVLSHISGNINNEGNKFINFFVKLFYLLLGCLIFFMCFLCFLILITSYFLPRSFPLLISVPMVILFIYILKKGLRSLGRVSEIIFPISIVIVSALTLLITGSFEINNFLPVLTNKVSNIFLATLTFSVISTAPCIFLIDKKIEFKEMLKNYLFGSIVQVAVAIITAGVLGTSLIRTFSFPEYIVLRSINFFNFLENVENIFAIFWLIDIFITTSLIIVKTNTHVFNNRLITISIYLIIIILINLYVINRYVIIMYAYHYFIYAIIITVTILIILLKIKKGQRP